MGKERHWSSGGLISRLEPAYAGRFHTGIQQTTPTVIHVHRANSVLGGGLTGDTKSSLSSAQGF
jgi:hypothetical protein